MNKRHLTLLHQRHAEHGAHTLNVNQLHQEQQRLTINGRIALLLTGTVGTMVCAYVFAALAIIGFPGWGASPTAYVQWVSQTFIQLVMLSVIMVGQNIQSRHAELRAEADHLVNQDNHATLARIEALLAQEVPPHA